MIYVKRKRVRFCIPLLCAALFFGSCGQEGEVPDIAEYNNSTSTMEKEEFIKDDKLNGPYSMECTQDYLYIVNKEGNCVLQYSYDGKWKKTIGNIGNGDGEFSKPAAIAHYEDEIYIADESGGRIQTFSPDGEFQKKYFIEALADAGMDMLDIEADKDNLYVSVAGEWKKQIYIYIVDKADGTVTETGRLCMGVFGRDESDSIYFAQAFDYFKDGSSSGYRSGASYLARLSDGKPEIMFRLPDAYSPAGVAVRDNRIYIYSSGAMEIDVFDSNGKYIETLYHEVATVDNRGVSCMVMDGDGNMYLPDSENNVIYKLRKK